jgi:hypothetical protein
MEVRESRRERMERARRSVSSDEGSDQRVVRVHTNEPILLFVLLPSDRGLVANEAALIGLVGALAFVFVFVFTFLGDPGACTAEASRIRTIISYYDNSSVKRRRNRQGEQWNTETRGGGEARKGNYGVGACGRNEVVYCSAHDPL